jgi:hypothetical protein
MNIEFLMGLIAMFNIIIVLLAADISINIRRLIRKGK